MKYSKRAPKIIIQLAVSDISEFTKKHNLQGTGSIDNPLIFSKSFSIPITLMTLISLLLLDNAL